MTSASLLDRDVKFTRAASAAEEGKPTMTRFGTTENCSSKQTRSSAPLDQVRSRHHEGRTDERGKAQYAIHRAGRHHKRSGQRHRARVMPGCSLAAERASASSIVTGRSWRSSRTSCFGLERDVPSSIVDVREREQVRRAVQEIVGALGPADILIPCAGVCRASTVDDLKIAELEEIVRINFLGMIYVVEAVLPTMLQRRSGHIVGISSMAGLRGIPFEPAYSASKAAVAAYLESLRSELRQGGSPSRRCSRAMCKPRCSMRSMA